MSDPEMSQQALLIEFVGFLSTHPTLHIMTDRSLLQNDPEMALRLVDQFLTLRAAAQPQSEDPADEDSK